ncbi:OmpA family protein [Halopseudomonas pachastrellae]|nr:OmpA family protein [Halopseudomonas pachastrellae]
MEDVRWQVEGDQFACRLSQSVAGYGEATFVRRAGERPAFELTAWDNPMRPGPAQVFNEPPPWRPGTATQPVGQGVVANGSQAMLLPYEQAGRMLLAWPPGCSRPSCAAAWLAESVRVVVSSVGYQQAWSDYQACVSKLLPISAAQAEQSTISFRSGGSLLSDDDAKSMLDAVLQYIQAADQLNEIVLDGHSDNQGNRLDNRELSRQRALAVRDYLMEKGWMSPCSAACAFMATVSDCQQSHC